MGICVAEAYLCHCYLPEGHKGPHKCGEPKCQAQWRGMSMSSNLFEVIVWPGGATTTGEAIADLFGLTT